MKRILAICSIAVISGACAGRHSGTRVVYVPAPPPAASTSEGQPKATEALIVHVPPPQPPPQVIVSMPAPEPKPQPRPIRPRTSNPRVRADNSEPPEEPADIPTLELEGTSSQAGRLHDEVIQVQKEVEQRIGHVRNSGLSRSEQKTLAGARAFLDQSTRALQQSDLQRALNLAQKANLLAQALPQ